jgi:hypothetical protein
MLYKENQKKHQGIDIRRGENKRMRKSNINKRRYN